MADGSHLLFLKLQSRYMRAVEGDVVLWVKVLGVDHRG
jgi:hypothetical protein